MASMSSLSFPATTLDARCRSCGYSLAGLPETRCPECGGAFDPTDPRTYSQGTWTSRARDVWVRYKKPALAVGRLGVCVLASWLLYDLGDGAFSFLFWTPVFYLLWRRQWLAAPVFMLLTPF